MQPNFLHRSNRPQFLLRSAVTGVGIMATNLLSKLGLAQTPALITGHWGLGIGHWALGIGKITS